MLSLESLSIFLSTFSLVFLAEIGDKTQTSVAGLASSMDPLLVWSGATITLVLVPAVGAWFGRTVLQRFSLLWLHRLNGVLFALFAILAAWCSLTL